MDNKKSDKSNLFNNINNIDIKNIDHNQIQKMIFIYIFRLSLGNFLVYFIQFFYGGASIVYASLPLVSVFDKYFFLNIYKFRFTKVRKSVK